MRRLLDCSDSCFDCRPLHCNPTKRIGKSVTDSGTYEQIHTSPTMEISKQPRESLSLMHAIQHPQYNKGAQLNIMIMDLSCC